MPPDEYSVGVNDSVYTNAVARLSMEYAVECAQLLNKPPSTYSTWQSLAPRIVILFNDSVPGFPGGLHPEYAGYFNKTVKQADTILLGFPLGVTTFGNMTPAARANDLHWYSKVTDYNGPAMTWGMFCIGFIELQMWAEAASNFNRSFANVQAPFGVWSETPSGGCNNFVTGAGGFLQTAFFGYSGLRVNDTSLRLHPVLPPQTSVVGMHGFAYKGARLNITYTANEIVVLVQADEAPEERMQRITDALNTHRNKRRYRTHSSNFLYHVQKEAGFKIHHRHNNNNNNNNNNNINININDNDNNNDNNSRRQRLVEQILMPYFTSQSSAPATTQFILVAQDSTRYELVPGKAVTLPLQDVVVMAQ